MTQEKHHIFMEAYKPCHDPFLRYCSALCYNKMDTEDLVQDVLLSAYRHFDKIEKKQDLLHYLIRAAKNRSISIWRKRRKETILLEKHTDNLRERGLPADMIVDIHLMYKALEKLPNAQRDAIMLFEISGFSMKEIAEIQQSTEGAVKTMVSRGRVKLRSFMEESHSVSSSAELFGVLKSILL